MTEPRWGSVKNLDEVWEQATREGRLSDAIEAYVRTYDWVTFPELMRRLGGILDAEKLPSITGKIDLEICPNIILWVGMSQSFADAVLQLQQEKRICPWPTDSLTYLFDGGALKIPVAKRVPKNGYKKEHWLPVCFRIQDQGDKKRLA